MSSSLPSVPPPLAVPSSGSAPPKSKDHVRAALSAIKNKAPIVRPLSPLSLCLVSPSSGQQLRCMYTLPPTTAHDRFHSTSHGRRDDRFDSGEGGERRELLRPSSLLLGLPRFEKTLEVCAVERGGERAAVGMHTCKAVLGGERE